MRNFSSLASSSSLVALKPECSVLLPSSTWIGEVINYPTPEPAKDNLARNFCSPFVHVIEPYQELPLLIDFRGVFKKKKSLKETATRQETRF